jgi:Fas apoptotic inhibitory molecule (FAIM1)
LPQFGWTVIANSGRRYRIGIYHGDQTGHVVVHAEGKVVITDFSVWDSKMYTFFVEDDLCEVAINKKKEGSYTYSCRINYEINTPLNAQRKQHARQNWRLGLLFATAVISFAVIVAVYFFLHPSAEKLRRERLLVSMGQGVEQEVQLLFDTTVSDWYHTYASWGRDGVLRLAWSADTLTPAGWKLEPGDVFIGYRSKEVPRLFYIDLQQPAPSLMEKYRRQTVQKLRQQYPSLSPDQIDCLLNAATGSAGARGLFLLGRLSGETAELLPVLNYCNIPTAHLRNE